MAMSRPRKHTGLVRNLYSDPRGRDGYYRYRRPDGSYKTFQAPSVAEANRLAEEANKQRDNPKAKVNLDRSELAYHIPRYIEYRERQDAKLLTKTSWGNRKYALNDFAKHFAGMAVPDITWGHLKIWWETLSYHQQKLRHAEFRRLFNYLMGEGLTPLPYNPFTTNDEKPRLYVTGEPEKTRMRLTRDAFWAIYDASPYPALQIAMGISLTTFMREGDICDLKWGEHVEGDLMRRVISKSLNQRGSASAARLQWDVGSHELLRTLLKRAREISLQNYRCPFVISHMPKVKKTGKTKEHACQVTPRRLVSMFAEARDLTGLYKGVTDRTPPTFHEVRSLAAKLAADAGYSVGQIRQDMAHDNEATTKRYQDEHALPYQPAGVVLTKDVLGRGF